MKQVDDKRMAMNREQISKLVFSMFKPFNDAGTALIQPYKKIDSLLLISQMEKRTSKLVQTAYLDELD
jgi:hypothetical protein